MSDGGALAIPHARERKVRPSSPKPRLLPQELLAERDAAALARAGDAARAFAASPVAPPETLVAQIAADAAALVGKAGGGA